MTHPAWLTICMLLAQHYDSLSMTHYLYTSHPSDLLRMTHYMHATRTALLTPYDSPRMTHYLHASRTALWLTPYDSPAGSLTSAICIRRSRVWYPRCRTSRPWGRAWPRRNVLSACSFSGDRHGRPSSPCERTESRTPVDVGNSLMRDISLRYSRQIPGY